MPGTVFTPRQVRVLKWVVIGLGVMLVVCFGLVIFGLVYQASQSGQAADAPGSPDGVAASAAAPVMTLDAEAGQSVAGVTLDADRLAIHLKGDGGEEIAVIDLKSGRLLRRIRVLPR